MFKRRFKPTLKKIDLSRTIAQDLEYYCKLIVLDELVCNKLRRPFDKELAEQMGKNEAKFYFVIKKNYEYDVIPGTTLEPWLKHHKVEELPETVKAKACIDHYVNACYQDLK